jgi:hypothetical protein
MKYARTENKLGFGSIFGAIALYLLFVSNDPPAPEGAAPPVWAHLLLAAISAVLAVRSLRGGAHVDDRLLRIRNIFRTQVVEWSEVSRFTMGLFPVLRYPSADVVLKDGRRIRMTMLAPPNPRFRPNNKETEFLLQRLEEKLEAVRKRDGLDSSH